MCRAQYFPVRHFTVNDGLPSNIIYDILQDQRGFIWVSTPNGVTRFDGKNFINYSVQDGLSDNEVLGLYEDSEGRIWFCTFNGIPSFFRNDTIYNPSNCKMLDYTPGNNFIISLFEDGQKNIWICSGNANIIIHPDGSNTRLKLTLGNYVFGLKGIAYILKGDTIFNYSSKEFVLLPPYSPGEKITPLMRAYPYDEGHVVLKRNPGRLELFDGKTTDLIITLDSLVRNRIYHILSDRDKNIFVTQSGGGVNVFRMQNGRYVKFATLLTDHEISPVLQDNNGDYWMGSLSEGLYLFQKDFSKSFLLNNKNGFTGENISKLAALNDSTLIIAMQGRISFLDTKTNQVLHTVLLPESTKLRGIAIDQNNNIWVGSDLHLYFIDNVSLKNLSVASGPIRNSTVKCLKNSDEGIIYISDAHLSGRISSLGNGHYLIDTLMRDRSFANAAFHKQAAFATSNGLYLFNNEQQTQLVQIPIQVSRSTLDMEFLDSIHLLLATNGFGIMIVNTLTGNADSYNAFSQRTTINDLTINGDEIWCATNTGIYCFLFDENTLKMQRHVSISEGLMSSDVRSVYILNDEIFAATSGGLQIFPADISTKTIPPSVYFNEILYNNKDQLHEAQQQFKDRNNGFAFRFSAIQFINAQSVIYAYRLRGKEYNWTETTDEVAKYTNLPSGHYVFEVKSKLDNSGWSTPVVYAFSVRIPFWETNSFKYILIVSVIAGIILLFMLKRNYEAKKIKRELEVNLRINDLENKSLQALMNPHFIYNALNSIQNFINKNDIDNSNLYLSKFSRLVRLNMDAISKSFISLEEEMDRLQLYLQVEKLRLGDKLNFDLRVAEDIPVEEIMIPAMIIQPIVENAIWHGVMPKEENGFVLISFEQLNDKSIVCKISDDGAGIAKTHTDKLSHNSKGLSLTSERLELLSKKYKKPFRISYTNSAPAPFCTEVAIEFPVLSKEIVFHPES